MSAAWSGTSMRGMKVFRHACANLADEAPGVADFRLGARGT
jgi:hypothetical protein